MLILHKTVAGDVNLTKDSCRTMLILHKTVADDVNFTQNS